MNIPAVEQSISYYEDPSNLIMLSYSKPAFVDFGGVRVWNDGRLTGPVDRLSAKTRTTLSFIVNVLWRPA